MPDPLQLLGTHGAAAAAFAVAADSESACWTGLDNVMWRAGSRSNREWLAKTQRFTLQVCRRSTSVPIVASSDSYQDALHLHARATACSIGSHSLLRSSASPLKQSLSTLDAALSSVVQFPLFSNPVLHVLEQDALRRLDSSWPNAIAVREEEGDVAVAVAAECVEEKVWPDVEEIRTAAVKTQPQRHRNRGKEYDMLFNRQRNLELHAWERAAKEYKKLLLDMCRKKLAPDLPFVKSLMLSWFEPVHDAMRTELCAIEKEEPGEDRTHYGPFLRGSGLTADKLTVLVMHKLMGLMMQDVESGCVRLANAAISIGEAVEQEVRYKRVLDKKTKENKPEIKKLDKALKSRKSKSVKSILQNLDPTKPWPSFVQAKVGSRLLEILISNSHLHVPVEDGIEVRPAFRHMLKIPKGGLLRSYGAIVCDPYLATRIDDSAKYLVKPYMPMLIPPRPWKGYSCGGYLFLRSTIMRTHGSRQQKEAVRNTSRSQLQLVFRALDTLGSSAWKINTEVLDVIEEIWKNGGGIAKLVDRSNVPLPPKPENMTEEEHLAFKKLYYKAKNTNSERHSQRCDLELKLSVARELKNEREFYYPHNLDFRGRAYPMHAHLNHLGSDVCRGLLQFARGRPLGESGLRWLKIHLANVYANGADKLPFQGRVAFADAHVDDILDSATHPLDGDRWWLDAEDPFQCLAACIELKKALQAPKHKEFISTLPIHQDGSCNGLQHYAALGRDRNGAKAVNLIGGDAPADVYSGIAARVRELVEEEIAKEGKDVQLAKLISGQIDRKLVKQTVMTSVYGVTFVGARNQITNKLRDKACISDETLLYKAGCYAAKITLNALDIMFEEARCIMNWLSDCAKLIAATGEAVRWMTPLGLPVVQPYRRPGRHVVKTTLQCLILRTDTDQPVEGRRQRSAFPPNFVHSMDGSHMMMTAVACKEAGLSFAGVHDSFWTHAGDVDKMNSILREKFVELYEQPILENLLAGFKKRWPKIQFPPLPARGDLDLREVLNSPYFFN